MKLKIFQRIRTALMSTFDDWMIIKVIAINNSTNFPNICNQPLNNLKKRTLFRLTVEWVC